MRRVDPARLVVLDESGANLAMGRSHAWVQRGHEFVEPRPMNWGTNLTLLGASRATGWVTLSTKWRAVTAEYFVEWVRRRLAPRLRPGDIVLLDNLRAHQDPAVRSILAQDVDAEVIVSDDGSCDQTIAILESIDSPRIQIIRNSANGGQFVNFNRALAQARGHFVQCFSHDDLAHAGFLQAQLDAFRLHESVGLVRSGLELSGLDRMAADVQTHQGLLLPEEHVFTP